MKRKRKTIGPLPILVVIAAVLFVTILILDKPQETPDPVEIVESPETTATTVPTTPYIPLSTPEEKLEYFAKKYNLPPDAWSEDMIALMKRNPDAERFVLNYPLQKGTSQETDLSGLVGTGEVPKLYQWDARWGYTQYGDKEMGLTGCGPTCLSMVCLYFLEDAKYSPRYVADFAQDNDYYADGFGTKWTLMSEGAQTLGLDVEVSYVEKDWVLSNLEAGHLIIVSMSPGSVFSPNGHYVLLAGQENGRIRVHDPNSPTNTEKLWEAEDFLADVSNIWIFSLPEE